MIFYLPVDNETHYYYRLKRSKQCVKIYLVRGQVLFSQSCRIVLNLEQLCSELVTGACAMRDDMRPVSFVGLDWR